MTFDEMAIGTRVRTTWETTYDRGGLDYPLGEGVCGTVVEVIDAAGSCACVRLDEPLPADDDPAEGDYEIIFIYRNACDGSTGAADFERID
jgi:hypothetical protein